MQLVVSAGTINLHPGCAFGLTPSYPDAVRNWTWPLFVVIPLVLMATLYGIGTVKMLRTTGRMQKSKHSAVYFLAAMASLVIALDSPIHEISEQLFWVHMTQHEILMLVSAPLLVLSRPVVPFLWALPRTWRDRVAGISRLKLLRVFWRGISAPVTAWLISAAALWIWHIPWLFDQTLSSDWVHAAQHITFLSTAMLFWWPVVEPRQLGYGTAVAYVLPPLYRPAF